MSPQSRTLMYVVSPVSCIGSIEKPMYECTYIHSLRTIILVYLCTGPKIKLFVAQGSRIELECAWSDWRIIRSSKQPSVQYPSSQGCYDEKIIIYALGVSHKGLEYQIKGMKRRTPPFFNKSEVLKALLIA
jgi:hypothetical protein